MPIHAGRGRSNILCQRPHSRTQNLHYILLCAQLILLCAQLVRNIKLSFPKPLINMEFFQDFFGRGDGTSCRLLADKWLEILQQICVVRQREAVISKVPRNLSSKSCGISALLSLSVPEPCASSTDDDKNVLQMRESLGINHLYKSFVTFACTIL